MMDLFFIGVTGFVLLVAAFFSYMLISKWEIDELIDAKEKNPIYYIVYMNFILNILIGCYLMVYSILKLKAII